LEQRGNVTGIYYQNPTRDKVIRIGVTSNSVGTSSITTNALSLQYYHCDIPNLAIAAPGFGLFLSLAIFRDIERIDACIRGDRYIGILMYYECSPTVVLGQWDTSPL
jgi:hypothetical protein